jgi:ferrochelatase
MAYYLNENDISSDDPSTGVIIANLGTPDEATARAVRRYLAEFLSDTRVIEAPRWIWKPILHGIILRTRPGKVAKNYKKIWTEQGSPLLAYTESLSKKVQSKIEEEFKYPVYVVTAMRYGNPSVKSALDKLKALNVKRILLLPLFPQYSATTTAAMIDAFTEYLRSWRFIPQIRIVNQYHDHPSYINALAKSIEGHWENHPQAERLVMSFHGLPKAYVNKGDPYQKQCEVTAQLLAERLELDDYQWLHCFQSRFGPKEWLKPYTSVQLAQLAKAGINSVDILCPGFPADCLETLEEIKMENKEVFMKAGGQSFNYIPALNDSDDHVQLMSDLIFENSNDWVDSEPT